MLKLQAKIKYYFMKRFDLFKNLLLVAIIFLCGNANAQVHPLAFGPHTLAGSTTMSNANWYADYVDARILVTAPVALAGPLPCKPAIIGSANWPNIVWPAGGIVNVPIVMDNSCDSFGGTTFTAGEFTGKIAVIWRGPISTSGACYTGTTFPFTQKAYNAQLAGAKAVIIINEYPGQAAFSPGYSAPGTWGLVTIPVLMIGNTDGANISSYYHSLPAGTVKMTISPWGLGYSNDLGLVGSGQAAFNYYAMPASQLAANNSAFNYKMLDGSFIANFGSHSATNVKLKSSLSWTPTGGSASVVHKDSVIWEGAFTCGVATDSIGDSILAMFPPSNGEYNLTATVPGTYGLTYTLTSDSTDAYPSDNTMTENFYITDSLFSRGRYDFVNKVPVSSSYEAYSNASEITWGNFYYIAKGGSYVSNIQYSVSNGHTAHPSNLNGSNDIYIFSWVDGSNSQPLDSIVQDGELNLVSWTTHSYVSGIDTSMGVITQTKFFDSANLNVKNIALDSNTWYFVAIDLPAASVDTEFVGIDGVTNPYPRMFGRWYGNGQRYLDYSNIVGTNASTYTTNPAANESPLPFAQVSFVNVVDSFSWTNVIGMIPSISMQTTTHPFVDHTGVTNQVKSTIKIDVAPNPASEFLNVTLGLDALSSSVSYKIIDAIGKSVMTVTHNNVLNENFQINISSLKPGNYYLLISADQSKTSKKFTVIK